jgi:hypothetical protein
VVKFLNKSNSVSAWGWYTMGKEQGAKRSELPDMGHLIFRNIFIGSNNRHLFGKSSCGKQSVIVPKVRRVSSR